MLPLKKDTKLVRSLQQKKFRQETGLFIVEGRKMVSEALTSGFAIHSVYTTDDDFLSENEHVMRIVPHEMDQISALTSPSGYLAVLHQKTVAAESALNGDVVVLDGIADPGNMGTILRTAEWFGITDILCTKDTVELYNPKVVQATMGSIYRVNVRYAAEEEISTRLKSDGFTLLGAVLGGSSLYDLQLPKRAAIVIGSESHGIKPAMKSHLDTTIEIPGSGGAESLNASVAAGIFMAEVFRGRR